MSKVRASGAQTRAAMMALYDQVGDAAGEAFGQRFLWEIGEAMAEVRGHRVAAERLYQVADAIVARMGPQGLPADTAPTDEEDSAAAAMEAVLGELRDATAAMKSRPPPTPGRVSHGVVFAVFLLGVGIGWALAWKHA